MTRKFIATGLLAWALGTLSASPLAAQAPAADAAQQAKLAERNQLWEQAQQLRGAGKIADAIAVGKKMLAIERELNTQPHDELAFILDWLGQAELERENFSQAEKQFQEALDARTAVSGAGNWKVTNARLQVEQVRLLANVSPQDRRDLRYAEQANGMLVRLRGEGQYQAAAELAEKCRGIRLRILGEVHPAYATCLNNLALLYDSLGDYARAEPLYRQAVEISKKALGEAHPGYATGLNNLAELYRNMGDYARAEPLYRQAMEIKKKALGEAHPDYATSLNNLALLYDSLGDYAQAEPLCRQALEIDKKALGESHPGCARDMNNLAFLYYSMGDYARAGPLFRQAAMITLNALQQSFLGESQRQQLAHTASVRFMLDSYLYFALEAQNCTDGDRVYPFWLQWKGLVLRQQWRQHALVDRPELKPTFTELEQVTARLARLALTVPAPEKRDSTRQQLAELSARKEQLERELAQQSAAFVAAAHAATVAELQQALPAEAALVDFVEYSQRLEPEKKGGKPTSKRQLAAFVVRHDGPIRLVSLGESRPVGEAIDRWRGKTDGDFGRSSEA